MLSTLKGQKYSQAKINDIGEVLKTVERSIRNFLREIEILYSSHAIVHPIMDLQKILVRLIIPYELVENKNVYEYNGLSMNGRGYENSREPWKAENSREPWRESKMESFNSLNNYIDLKLIPTPPIPRPEVKKYVKKNKEKKERTENERKNNVWVSRRFLKRKPIFSEEQENEIAEWTEERMKEKEFTRKDIMQKAMSLYRGEEEFKASKGWVNKFLKRHPELFEKVKIRERENKIRKKLENPHSSENNEPVSSESDSNVDFDEIEDNLDIEENKYKYSYDENSNLKLEQSEEKNSEESYHYNFSQSDIPCFGSSVHNSVSSFGYPNSHSNRFNISENGFRFNESDTKSNQNKMENNGYRSSTNTNVLGKINWKEMKEQSE